MPDIDHDVLTDAQVEAYHRDGFIHLPGLLADQVEAMAAESERMLGLTELIRHDNLRTLPKRDATTGEYVTERFDPTIDISTVFRDVVSRGVLPAVVGRLLGDDPVLFKDKLIFKQPGTEGYRPHQDWNQWKPFAADLLSVMVAIDGADASNGALELYPGMHDVYYEGGPGESSAPQAENRPERDGEGGKGHHPALNGAVEGIEPVLIATQPGDCIVFHCLTPHRSGVNRSDRSRRQFYPSYGGARHGDRYDAHYQHVWKLRQAAAGSKKLSFK